MGEGDELVPFHKLTGWTTYSLVEPIEKILGWKFDGLEDMTGLPEYRNGACLRVIACRAPHRFVEPFCSPTPRSLLFLADLAGWMGVCATGDHEKTKKVVFSWISV